MDNYVKGIFTGALLMCFFMLIWPKATTCQVVLKHGNGNSTIVQYGIIKGD